jgi:subtilisin-like proprotein convertase family protein
MKKCLFGLFAMMFFTATVFGQAYMSERLLDEISKAESNSTPVKALVMLKDQADIQKLDNDLYAMKASLEYRAYMVITTLQQKADATQVSILNELAAKRTTEVLNYQSFWIVNMVAVEAVPSVLYELSRHVDVGYMDLDAKLEWDQPVKRVAGKESSPGGVEPGLKAINAHKMWAAGFTGAGYLVMNDDTGVQYNHPAFAARWRGNFTTHTQSWFNAGAPSTGTPTDCDGHGTHTMGTMCGLDPATHDTIGVAFGAQWIAANGICSNPHTSQSIAGWQWAMNPDSNAGTITDMPVAIGNSWFDPSVSDCQAGPYWNAMISVEASGIAIVFSAGNSGPGAGSITIPKNTNIDLVTAFATGAVNANTAWPYTIASFSSRGPSTCTASGPDSLALKIKPEICAPGVSVRSSYPTNTYTSMDGTSMACPHVVGALTLLRQAHPGMTGKQLKMALYTTARDLGDPGEDNNYGRGMIDIWAAHLSCQADQDYAVGPFVNFPAFFELDSTYDIKAEVLNGTVAHTDVPVVFFVNNAPADTVLLSLDSLGKDTVSFTWTAAPAGAYNLKIKSFLDTDIIPSNDSVMANIIVSDADYGLTEFYNLPAGNIRIGRQYSINAIVKNFGSAQTDVPVRFFENSVQVGTDQLVSLNENESDTLYFNWTPATTGVKNLRIQSFLTNDRYANNDTLKTTMSALDTNDYSVTTLIGLSDTATVSVQKMVKARVVNNGLARNDVPIVLMENGVKKDTVLLSLDESTVDTVDFLWIPSVAGNVTVTVKSFLNGDAVPANDSVKLVVLVYPQSMTTKVYTTGTINLAIPDNNTTGVTSTIIVPDSIIVYDVNIRIDSLIHTWDSDLDITLLNRGGTTVDLDVTSDNGSSGDNFIGTLFDDDAAVSVTTGTAPFTGTYKIEQIPPGLTQFNGTEGIGNWRLKLVDDAGSDNGTLYRWSVIIKGMIHNTIIGIDDETRTPRDYALHQNYPNPFNPTTTIRYDLKGAGKVTLKIYNILGQEVRTLVNKNETAGFKSVVWNGKDNMGKAVSSGLYIYRLEAGQFVKSHKMMFIK